MSKIDPPSSWSDIDVIDTFERLLGGISGPLNRAVTGLTARTKWLRDNTISLLTLGARNGASLVGFEQSGSGATQRNAQDKLREVSISVKDFGAVGNGLTDDSAAFAAAAARAGTNGQVDVPAGTYLLTTPNIGLNSTSWNRVGDVTFTGAGSLAWSGGRNGYRYRFGAEFGAEQLVDFNRPDDPTAAHMHMYRKIAGTTDRSGNIYAEMENISDVANCSAMFSAFHTGPSTVGFPNAVTMYSTATRLNGASVLSSYISVNSPAYNIPGSEWNAGTTYAQEINFGNRWAEFGLQRDITLSKFVAGTLYAPDVLNAQDGGVASDYEFHAQFGITFCPGSNGGDKDRRMWIPIHISQDSIPGGGIGFHARGATLTATAERPLALLEAALNWQRGVDLTKASYTEFALGAPNVAFSEPTTGVTQARIHTVTAGAGELEITTNIPGTEAGGFRRFTFRNNGSFNLPSNPPIAATAVGRSGDIQWDSGFVYVCVAANTWKRAALASW